MGMSYTWEYGMSNALCILKMMCEDRKEFVKLSPYIKDNKNLTKEVKILFNLIRRYFDKYARDEVGRDDLRPFFDLQYPQHGESDLFYELIEQMWKQEVSEDVRDEIIEQYLEESAATLMLDSLVPVMHGEKHGVVKHMGKIVEDYISKLKNPPEVEEASLEPCELTMVEMVDMKKDNPAWSTGIPILDKTIGGIERESLGLIYAYVDTGKTSLAMTIATNLARDMKDTENNILYCGNEESAKRLRWRMNQAFTNWNREELEAQPAEADAISLTEGAGRIKIVDQIEKDTQLIKLMDEWRPVVLFVDLAGDINIKVSRREEGVQYLEQLFKWYRRLANKYECAIIGVSQGRGEINNAKYLEMTDVYGSRVAIQRSLDWALGIGRLTEKGAEENLRFINVPKNKMYDGQNERFTMYFDKTRCIWRQA
jgi:KaiC/GvpD/RAD55 family RecA-like ATPase